MLSFIFCSIVNQHVSNIKVLLYLSVFRAAAAKTDVKEKTIIGRIDNIPPDQRKGGGRYDNKD